ncbi:MAG TPA: glycosyltransferase, partial [Chitinophagaceae bacterium]|nr:glycosyltransferase [Chitinophagaceae bacterium]
MSAQKKKIAIIENHELGIYSIRHDLVKEIASLYDTMVLTELEGTFHGGDLHEIIKFVNVGKAVLNPVKAVKYYKNIRKALKEFNPDVCITFTIRPTIYGNLVTHSLKIPTISTITGTGPLFESKTVSYTIARKLYKKVLKKTKFVFFPNHDDMEEFSKRKYVTQKQICRVPGSGVN